MNRANETGFGMKIYLRTALSVMALATGISGAYAQSGSPEEVLIMRRPISEKGLHNGQTPAPTPTPTPPDGTPTPTPTPTPTETYSWLTGDFLDPGQSCGDEVQTRSVSCVRFSDNAAVANSLCTGAQPEATQIVSDQSGCTYAWISGEFGAPVPACGTSSHSRNVTCVRNGDNVTVADGLCASAGAKPATTEAIDDMSSCTYAWDAGEWIGGGNLCGYDSQTRVVQCKTDTTHVAVEDSKCDAGTRPISFQNIQVTSGCEFRWYTDEWVDQGQNCGDEVQIRSVVCVVGESSAYDDSFCLTDVGPKPLATQTVPDTSGCTYAWAPGAWQTGGVTCGNDPQTRAVICQSVQNHHDADDALCTSEKPATFKLQPVTTSCAASWVTGEWLDPGQFCGDEEQTRAVTCQYSSGDLAPDNLCLASEIRPDESRIFSDISGCPTFAGHWEVDDWTIGAPACGNRIDTRTVVCKKPDATITDDADCDPDARPYSSNYPEDYSGCLGTWDASEWETVSTACRSISQSRIVSCKISGEIVGDEQCNPSIQPSSYQDVNDSSYCTGTWNAGEWFNYDESAGHCGDVPQIRVVQCKDTSGEVIDDRECGADNQPDSFRVFNDTSGC